VIPPQHLAQIIRTDRRRHVQRFANAAAIRPPPETNLYAHLYAQALAVEATDSHHRLSSHRCRWREERDEAALALALKNLALARAESKEPGVLSQYRPPLKRSMHAAFFPASFRFSRVAI
jgi:hypothetical protein